jgi:hypothetical protein
MMNWFSGDKPLNAVETALLTKLQANRKVVLYQEIPDNMMNEFITGIYSNRQLVRIIKKAYRSRLIGDKADVSRMYLEYLLRLALSSNQFGARLIIYHGVDPEIIVTMILKDI